MQANPGQFRIHGRKPRKGESGAQVEVICAAQVSNAARAFLTRQFLEPRWTILHRLDANLPPDKALTEDLAERGYDLATLRFSVFLKNFGPRRPAIRVLRQRPGLLHARWSWLDYDHSPDIVCSWQVPCSRRDCNLLLSVIGTPGQTREQVESVFYRPSRDMMAELDSLGFDIRTFRFSIEHREHRAAG